MDSSRDDLPYPDLISYLRRQLTFPLPGIETQFRMAHLDRIREFPVRNDVRRAAVLVLLFEKSEAWHLVFIRRKSIVGDVHAGQISFPGGRARTDETLEHAALRESFEEIHSDPEKIDILGRLTQLHIPVSNHLVYPIVGVLSNYMGWVPQESEVDLILEIPLSTFLHTDTLSKGSIRMKDGLILRDVPGYQVDEHFIWGATAMILSEFSEILVGRH